MSKIYAVLFWMLALSVWAGDSGPSAPAPRREFRQSKTTPYIFIPVAYLENGAPVPLRFEWSCSDGVRPNPPRVPKPTPTPTPLATPSPSSSPTPEARHTPEPLPVPPIQEPVPAFPPPENAQPVPQGEALDLTRYPAEVVNIFKNPYNIPKARKKFLEPVFEPAQPPSTQQSGKPGGSKATYRQN